MYKKMKRFLLCFLAVSMMTTVGSISADNDAEIVTDSAISDKDVSQKEAEPLVEEQEEIEISAEDVKRLMTLTDTIDGIQIYARSEEYKDEIWNAHGGNPKDKDDYDKNADPTPEQLEAEADIDILDDAGDFVAIDESTGKVIAIFDDDKNCDEGVRYLSEAGRYLLVMNEDLNKAVRFRNVISLLDNPLLFATKDLNTLELMDKDCKKIEASYTFSEITDEKAIYYTADKTQMAWLSTDKTQVFATVRYATENDDYRMLVDDSKALIGLENKATGYIWWSSPIDASRDTIATPALINTLYSSNQLNCGIPSGRSSENYISNDINNCTISVSDISNGIEVVYNYSKAGIKYPVQYTLEDDHLKASLKVDQIQETVNDKIAVKVTLMNAFGAGSSDEDGYFVIPDGSGALINFNNGKYSMKTYSQNVYGSDSAAVPVTKKTVNEQVYFPCYGIVKEDNAMLVVAAKGDTNATISASTSGKGQSNTSYNLCNFTFNLRGQDIFYMSGDATNALTVFESGKIKGDDIELHYYPISKENANYVDVAEKYREYLIEEENLTTKAKADSAPLYIDLYGGVEKQVSTAGIPVTKKTSITDYSQAKKIISTLVDNGVDDMVVSYNHWTDAGIKNQVDDSFDPSGTLGGKKDFNSFVDYMNSNNIAFYPAVENKAFYSGNGYYSFNDTVVRISGAYSRIVSYDRAYGIQNTSKDPMSLLSPNTFKTLYSDIAKSYSSNNLSGISLGSMTTSLYGDYGKNGISRNDTAEILKESYQTLNNDLSDGILADSANAYAVPYVSHITDVPLSSSRYHLFDEDIPFYQMVLHGIVPYSTTAVNGNANSEELLLKAIASGSNLYFDMIYEDTSILKDTNFDIYYYANYENWVDTAVAEYNFVSPILKKVSDATIISYETSDSDVITTKYSNGVVTIVDMVNKTVECDGVIYDLNKLREEGGVRF